MMEEQVAVELSDALARVGLRYPSVKIVPGDAAQIDVPWPEAFVMLRALAAYQPPVKGEVVAGENHDFVKANVTIMPLGEGLPYHADKENREDAEAVARKFGLATDRPNEDMKKRPAAAEKNVGEQIVDALLKAGILKAG